MDEEHSGLSSEFVLFWFSDKGKLFSLNFRHLRPPTIINPIPVDLRWDQANFKSPSFINNQLPTKYRRVGLLINPRNYKRHITCHTQVGSNQRETLIILVVCTGTGQIFATSRRQRIRLAKGSRVDAEYSAPGDRQ